MSPLANQAAADARELVAERLCVAYGQVPVLHDVDLHIALGECVTLIGPNGAGKTTLMRALLGLVPPSSGRVAVGGTDLADMSGRARGHLAAYVPQALANLPAFTVRELVATGRYPHVAPLRPLSARDEAAIDAALRACTLESLAERRVDQISGGERQKALLAAAIAQDAQMMFLDEPTTALDPAYQIELVRMLRDWHARGRTLVVVSHDLHLPAALGGRVIALREGRIVAHGSADEMLAPERLSDVYAARFVTLVAADGRRYVCPDFLEK